MLFLKAVLGWHNGSPDFIDEDPLCLTEVVIGVNVHEEVDEDMTSAALNAKLRSVSGRIDDFTMFILYWLID